jgi:protein involved in polysaccharide export with SLBB domain
LNLICRPKADKTNSNSKINPVPKPQPRTPVKIRECIPYNLPVNTIVKRVFLLLILLLTIATAMASKQTQHYVRPGDTVAINCDEEGALNKQYTVSKDGFVIMQYVGAVQIAGLTEEGAAIKIGQALVTERILPKATVGVQVVSSKQAGISYSGAVANNGLAQPQPGMRLSDIVALAQPTAQANLQRVRVVTAAGNEIVVNYAAFDGVDTVNNPQVLVGDSVFFDPITAKTPRQPSTQAIGQQGQGGPLFSADQQPFYTPLDNPGPAPTPVQNPTPTPAQSNHPTYQQPNQNQNQNQLTPVPSHQGGGDGYRDHDQDHGSVTVQGAVESPTQVPFHPGMTVSIAIAHAGGFLKDSDADNVKIDEKVDGHVRSVSINVNDIQKGFAGDRMLLPGDVIEVPFKHRRGTNFIKIAGIVILGLILIH